MSPLENAIQEQIGLTNKGYSVEQIQCAALQIIAERTVVLTTPIITHEPMPVEESDGAD